ncbi:hypothetical protein IAT40_004128 [Kwoniella sp. CBS 6097]
MFSVRTAIFISISALLFGKTVLADSTFAGCFADDLTFDSAVDATAASSPQACSDGDNNYNCQCGTNSLSGFNSVSTCAATSYFIYTHPAAAQASGLARRQERLERAHARASSYCPSGLTACKVSPLVDEYECIDTNAELESCGGCLYGQMGNSTSTAGQDCTSIGAKLGASTCINGQCVASACQEGRDLANGQCVGA